MSALIRSKQIKKFLKKEVDVIIDRPLGSMHPKHGFIYETNYRYVPNTKAPDCEELDAYFLGIRRPLRKAKGVCIAIIHRIDDNDDKLVIVPNNKQSMKDKEILKAVHFQEKWFVHYIIRN